jgi:hypothetical protein
MYARTSAAIAGGLGEILPLPVAHPAETGRMSDFDRSAGTGVWASDVRERALAGASASGLVVVARAAAGSERAVFGPSLVGAAALTGEVERALIDVSAALVKADGAEAASLMVRAATDVTAGSSRDSRKIICAASVAGGKSGAREAGELELTVVRLSTAEGGTGGPRLMESVWCIKRQHRVRAVRLRSARMGTHHWR